MYFVGTIENNCLHNSNDNPKHMSRVMSKPAFCICENKDADQPGSNCAADQRLCFRYMDIVIATVTIVPSKPKPSKLQQRTINQSLYFM